eukprot:1937864-Alexandrium_andersonii.AAC.1
MALEACDRADAAEDEALQREHDEALMDWEARAHADEEATLGLAGAPRPGALNSGLQRDALAGGWWHGVPPL